MPVLVNNSELDSSDDARSLKDVVFMFGNRSAWTRDAVRCTRRMNARMNTTLTRKQVTSEFVNYDDLPLPRTVKIVEK